MVVHYHRLGFSIYMSKANIQTNLNNLLLSDVYFNSDIHFSHVIQVYDSLSSPNNENALLLTSSSSLPKSEETG